MKKKKKAKPLNHFYSTTHTRARYAEAEFEQYGTEYDVQRLVEQAGEVLEARKALEWLRANAEVTVLPPVK